MPQTGTNAALWYRLMPQTGTNAALWYRLMPQTGTNELGIYTPALEPSFPSRHSSPRRRRRRHLRRQAARFRRHAASPAPSPTTSPALHRPLVADFPTVNIALLPLPASLSR